MDFAVGVCNLRSVIPTQRGAGHWRGSRLAASATPCPSRRRQFRRSRGGPRRAGGPESACGGTPRRTAQATAWHPLRPRTSLPEGLRAACSLHDGVCPGQVSVAWIKGTALLHGVCLTEWQPISRATKPESGLHPDPSVPGCSFADAAERDIRRGGDASGGVQALTGDDSLRLPRQHCGT